MVDVGWRPYGIGVAVVGVVAIVGLTLAGRTGRCGDVERLLVESVTGFEAIQGEPIDPVSGQWSTTWAIDGASSCSIVIDPERARYVCTWEHSLTSGDGRTGYDTEVERVRGCLDGVPERQDTSVNHPDFWASTHFSVPDGEIVVSLKNKSALGTALVTVGADTTPGR